MNELAGIFTVIISDPSAVLGVKLVHGTMLYSVENGSPTVSIVLVPFKTGAPEKLTRENVVTPRWVRAVKKDKFLSVN